jgi:hypothetical protein
MMHYRITNSIFHFIFACICCLFLVLFVGCCFFLLLYIYLIFLFTCYFFFLSFALFCLCFFFACVFLYILKKTGSCLFLVLIPHFCLYCINLTWRRHKILTNKKKPVIKINKIKVLKEDIYLDRFYLTCLYVFIVQMIIYLAYSAIFRCLPANHKE